MISIIVETPSDSIDVISKAVAEKCYMMVLVAMATTAVLKVTTVLAVMITRIATLLSTPIYISNGNREVQQPLTTWQTLADYSHRRTISRLLLRNCRTRWRYRKATTVQESTLC
jgi:hypothetical protein